MIRFSKSELKDLTKAWLAISLAFAILYSLDLSKITIFSAALPSFSFIQFFTFFAISLLTAGIGFLFHELGHKVLAQKYGAKAQFQSFDGMLLLAIGLSFFGFLFAAPGAVFIHGRLDRRQNGKVSLAGPAVNLILSGIFLILSFFLGWNTFLRFGFSINAWLALFNMIPIMPFDGAKVLAWNRIVYGMTIALALLAVFFI